MTTYFPEANSPLSPSATTEEQWISDLLSKSAPMTTSHSFTNNFTMAMTNFELNFQTTDFSSLLENESIFSNSSRSSTVSSTPPIKEEEFHEVRTDLLDSVSNKLLMMQKRNDLTPKALESIFDTKDVLKDAEATGLGKNVKETNSQRRRRCLRKRLTESQKEAHNKVEKKYRVNINARINSLQTIIPWLSSENEVPMDLKLNKSVILEKAYDYIVHLRSENEEMKSRLNDSN